MIPRLYVRICAIVTTIIIVTQIIEFYKGKGDVPIITISVGLLAFIWVVIDDERK